MEEPFLWGWFGLKLASEMGHTGRHPRSIPNWGVAIILLTLLIKLGHLAAYGEELSCQRRHADAAAQDEGTADQVQGRSQEAQ